MARSGWSSADPGIDALIVIYIPPLRLRRPRSPVSSSAPSPTFEGGSRCCRASCRRAVPPRFYDRPTPASPRIAIPSRPRSRWRVRRDTACGGHVRKERCRCSTMCARTRPRADRRRARPRGRDGCRRRRPTTARLLRGRDGGERSGSPPEEAAAAATSFGGRGRAEGDRAVVHKTESGAVRSAFTRGCARGGGRRDDRPRRGCGRTSSMDSRPARSPVASRCWSVS